MGQPVAVTPLPSSQPGLLRFEANRSLTGMGHEHFRTVDRRHRSGSGPILARRLLETGEVEPVHVYSNIVTVDLRKGFTGEALEQIIENLYIYYRPGFVPPPLEMPAEEAPAAARRGDGDAGGGAAGADAARVPADLLERSRLAKERGWPSRADRAAASRPSRASGGSGLRPCVQGSLALRSAAVVAPNRGRRPRPAGAHAAGGRRAARRPLHDRVPLRAAGAADGGESRERAGGSRPSWSRRSSGRQPAPVTPPLARAAAGGGLRGPTSRAPARGRRRSRLLGRHRGRAGGGHRSRRGVPRHRVAGAWCPSAVVGSRARSTWPSSTGPAASPAGWSAGSGPGSCAGDATGARSCSAHRRANVTRFRGAARRPAAGSRLGRLGPRRDVPATSFARAASRAEHLTAVGVSISTRESTGSAEATIDVLRAVVAACRSWPVAVRSGTGTTPERWAPTAGRAMAGPWWPCSRT